MAITFLDTDIDDVDEGTSVSLAKANFTGLADGDVIIAVLSTDETGTIIYECDLAVSIEV